MKHRNFQSLTLNPKGDQYVFSPYKINTLFSRQVMRIKKLSTKKISTKRCLVFLILSCSLTGNVTGNIKKGMAHYCYSENYMYYTEFCELCQKLHIILIINIR